MLGLLLLLGFTPHPQPDPAIHDGPPAPHLSLETARQWQLSSRPGWRAFRARWGPGWAVRWDERNGTPRFLWAPAVPLSQADALAADLARLTGIEPAELVAQAPQKRGDRSFRRFSRRWQGAEVIGDELLLVAIDGRIAGVWVRLSPIGLSARPRPGEQVLPLPRFRPGEEWQSESTGLMPVLVTERISGPIHRYHDRSGALVHAYDERRFATVEVEHRERTVGDASMTSPARLITLTDSSGAMATSADDGSHPLFGSLSVQLDGPELALRRNGHPISVEGTGDILLEGGGNISQASATVLHHFHVAWDWLEDRWPSHPWLFEVVLADVDNGGGACNAYYSSGMVTFLQGYGGHCSNFGEIADVVYHELGHGIHHYILVGGTFASDISEGSSDFVAATLNDDPVLAPGAFPGGGFIREIETDRVYPADRSGESHNDGLIWGSFLWNLREQRIAELGDAAGARSTDLLFLGALEQGPTLTDVYEAVILADDDNGDLTDGTPNACELVDLLDHHGLGPGPIGVVQLEHEPLGPQASETAGYPLSFQLLAPTAACSDLDEEAIRLWWSTDPSVIPGVDDALPDTGATDADTGATDADAGWTALELERDGWTWSGTIPRQPATTRVWYFIEAASTDGSEILRSHGGDRDGLYSFAIGDQENLWCEDFSEASDWSHGPGLPDDPSPAGSWEDEWVIGPPLAGVYSADRATSITNIAATRPGALYRNLNAQHLLSPVIDLAQTGPMLQLRFQRWLTVEDGIYDQAILFGGESAESELWRNRSSEGGTWHVLDQGWTLQEIPLPEPEDGGPARFRFAWALQSDPGLEFGGWHLDDVCITRLADLPGHYQRASLSASDDAEVVQIRWEQPWIEPLVETLLVKRVNGWPGGPEDGELLDRDTDPLPGEAKELLDGTLTEGESAFYALYAFDGETWYTALVEGENADIGGVLAEPVDTGTVTDTGAPPTDPGERDPSSKRAEPGCGCASGGGRGGVGLLTLLPLLILRRRGPKAADCHPRHER